MSISECSYARLLASHSWCQIINLTYWCLFLCSMCTIALVVSTVNRWVLIILWRFCESYEPCTFTWKSLFQACLIKRDFSWKCIGRQPDSEGVLSRAVHGVYRSFTEIFHLLSHSIFLNSLSSSYQILYYFICIHAVLLPYNFPIWFSFCSVLYQSTFFL